MKTNKTLVWRTYALLFISGALCLNSSFSLAVTFEGAYVKIDGWRWAQGGCPPGPLSKDPTNGGPVMTSKCDVMYAEAGGANNYYVPGDGTPCGVNVRTPADISVIDHGTGCKIEPDPNNGDGFGKWKISEPKHSGYIVFKSDLSGFCNIGQ